MSDDDVIRMALEACGEDPDQIAGGWVTLDHKELVRFVSIITAYERERCAKKCEDKWLPISYDFDLGRNHCAKKIREMTTDSWNDSLEPRP